MKNTKAKDCVIVTGASTGIGFSIAELLANKGYQVLAGVRTLEDQVRLEDLHSNIQSFILDVAQSESIQKAFTETAPILDQATRVSLVNNAGIAVPGPIEGLKISDLRRQFDVNFFGLVEWTQQVLPFIRKTKGKIFNMSSVSGLVASPYLGAYASSKFALEAMSDALRREMLRFGVEVVIIEPGPIRTPIWNKGMQLKDVVSEKLRPGMSDLYNEEFIRITERVDQAAQKALPVEEVSKVVFN